MKYDIVDFVLLMIIGRTAGTRIKGAEDAIKDGSLWGNLCEEYGYDLVRIVLEELHELMSSHKQNPERKQ